MRSLAIAVLCACGAATPAAPPPSPTTPAPPPHALGMNDVSILLPLPRDPGVPVIAGIGGLVDPRWFDALVAPGDLGPKVGDLAAYAAFQVVAVRFDLCERLRVGACPVGSDGRLRVVLQPCVHAGQHIMTQDIAIHAFYPIAAAELAGVIDELRALAALQDAPADAPLMVSPAAAAGRAAYVDRLRALVLRFARADRIARLTVIGQRAGAAAFAWVFRGLDRAARGAGFAPMVIPAIDATQQATLLAGGDAVFDAAPIADAPAGFALATNGVRFAAASPTDRERALAALTELQDPTRHDTIDTQCLGCHVATYLTRRRALSLGVDPAAVPGRFTSRFNVAVDSVASRDARVVRAFGWAGDAPAISQRVANDTAAVLAEIAERFPPRP
ncbi:MAG TPA: hypothetical protein VFP84_17160 [Kofleriaceae bacterium]|nr:hypothetical protein [Kofleriaceae bacterium]